MTRVEMLPEKIYYIFLSIIITHSIDRAIAARNMMGVANFIVSNQLLFPVLVVVAFLLSILLSIPIDFVLHSQRDKKERVRKESERQRKERLAWYLH